MPGKRKNGFFKSENPPSIYSYYIPAIADGTDAPGPGSDDTAPTDNAVSDEVTEPAADNAIDHPCRSSGHIRCHRQHHLTCPGRNYTYSNTGSK